MGVLARAALAWIKPCRRPPSSERAPARLLVTFDLPLKGEGGSDAVSGLRLIPMLLPIPRGESVLAWIHLPDYGRIRLNRPHTPRRGFIRQGLSINSKIAAFEDKTLSARSCTIIAARFGDRGFDHDAKG